MDITEQIGRLLDEKYAADETFADCFTVDIELKPGQKLYVYMDSDSGIDFDKCRAISRFLESHLDTNGWLGEKYVLEVSSPGLDRPLRFPRQYLKNAGRNLQITLKDKTQQTGLLKAVEAESIVLEQTVQSADEKKKKMIQVETAIRFDQIAKAVVKPVF